ncbi:hypothetical protein ANN_06906 [Periplaneta americana]|uniref:DUF4817 domain-containing protein n=1 Tax=Periplaneta americana TaxID=6978 RepID=A0ABQ8TFL0_PERAM|nr:hypothetical protein ANN_06906 [Periplaneta americana]
MALPGEHKSFCVLDYHVNNSMISVQRHFRTKYRINPPTGKSIRKWYVQFRDSGSHVDRTDNTRLIKAAKNLRPRGKREVDRPLKRWTET